MVGYLELGREFCIRNFKNEMKASMLSAGKHKQRDEQA
jgi:hypothetical protein